MCTISKLIPPCGVRSGPTHPQTNNRSAQVLLIHRYIWQLIEHPCSPPRRGRVNREPEIIVDETRCRFDGWESRSFAQVWELRALGVDRLDDLEHPSDEMFVIALVLEIKAADGLSCTKGIKSASLSAVKRSLTCVRREGRCPFLFVVT